VVYTNRLRMEGQRTKQQPAGLSGRSQNVSDPSCQLWKRRRETWDWNRKSPNEGWWGPEPDVGRVAHGVPARVDRLKGLGNAVVPQQAYPIFRAIAEIESG